MILILVAYGLRTLVTTLVLCSEGRLHSGRQSLKWCGESESFERRYYEGEEISILYICPDMFVSNRVWYVK